MNLVEHFSKQIKQEYILVNDTSNLEKEITSFKFTCSNFDFLNSIDDFTIGFFIDEYYLKSLKGFPFENKLVNNNFIYTLTYFTNTFDSPIRNDKVIWDLETNFEDINLRFTYNLQNLKFNFHFVDDNFTNPKNVIDDSLFENENDKVELVRLIWNCLEKFKLYIEEHDDRKIKKFIFKPNINNSIKKTENKINNCFTKYYKQA